MLMTLAILLNVAQLDVGQMAVYNNLHRTPRNQLMDLGPPEALGGVTLEGNPHIYIRVDYATAKITGGIFEASKGKAVVFYPFTEHATIIAGWAKLTDETGLTKLYLPGDSYIIRQGSTITWEVALFCQKSFLNIVE